jgi:hypothetical protein
MKQVQRMPLLLRSHGVMAKVMRLLALGGCNGHLLGLVLVLRWQEAPC